MANHRFNGNTCFNCGRPAPYGYRRKGILSSIPEGKRGYLWACGEHRGEAEARKARAEG